MANVKKQKRRPRTRISSKHQITIPVDALRKAGLEAGDHLVASVEGPGRIVLEREDDLVAKYAGILTGAYEPDELAKMRAQWR